MSKEVLERLDTLSKAVTDSVGAVREKVEAIEAAHKEDAEKLDTKIEEVRSESAAASQRLEKALKDGQGRAIQPIGLTDQQIKEYSISRAIRGYLIERKPKDVCGFEYDCSQESLKLNREEMERRDISEHTQARAMTTLMDSTGGFMVPEEVSQLYFGLYKARLLMSALNVTMVQTMGYPIRFNKQTGATTAYRVGEGQAPAASDLAFGQANLTPKGIAARTVMSEENVMWSDPAVDQLAMRDIMEQIMLRKDLDFFSGTGAEGEPIGMFNVSGVVNLDTGTGAGQAYTYEKIIDMVGAVADNNALVNDGSLGFVSRPGVFRLVRKEQDGAGNYIYPPWVPDSDIFPWPTHQTTQLPAGADPGATYLGFGRWSDAINVDFGGLVLKRSDVATDGTYNGLTEGWLHIVAKTWNDHTMIRPSALVYDDTADFA